MTYHQLTQEERYLIAAQRMCGHSPAQMARVLGRHRSTVVRELCRNATHHDGRAQNRLRDHQKLRARNTDEVTRAATRAIRRHCRNFKTLTLDNGTEFHNYAVLEQRFPVHVYFATPYHSWERGSNEDFNGLLRQYLPKGTCMSAVTQAQCDHIADDLNNRPRKRFGFNTPASLYHRN